MTDREVGCMGKYWNIINLIIIAYINWGPRGDRKPLRWFRRRFLNEGTGQWSGQVKRAQSTRNENSGKLLRPWPGGKWGAQWELDSDGRRSPWQKVCYGDRLPLAEPGNEAWREQGNTAYFLPPLPSGASRCQILSETRQKGLHEGEEGIRGHK